MRLPNKAPRLFGARKHGDIVTVDTPTGKKGDMIFIGRGRFANAFWDGKKTVLVYTTHNDLSKDILASIHRPALHLPKVKFKGYIERGPKEIGVYQMPFYKQMSKESYKRHSKLIWALNDARDYARITVPGNVVRTQRCRDFNEAFIMNADVPNAMVKSLSQVFEASLDWGDHYVFDSIRAVNLATDDKDNLILLDPMFDAEIMKRHLEAKKK